MIFSSLFLISVILVCFVAGLLKALADRLGHEKHKLIWYGQDNWFSRWLFRGPEARYINNDVSKGKKTLFKLQPFTGMFIETWYDGWHFVNTARILIFLVVIPLLLNYVDSVSLFDTLRFILSFGAGFFLGHKLFFVKKQYKIFFGKGEDH